MYDCNCLIHPFQNDPGTSQSARVREELLSGAAKIDARTLADLLDFFTQMSRHINFYDTELGVGDWQAFFKNSIPFTLASIIKTPATELQDNFSLYNSLFEKKPSAVGLQLHIYFIYYRFIQNINNWCLSVKDSGLPVERLLQTLIKDKLQQPVKLFIKYTNAAVKWYGIKKIDFSKLSENPAWNLKPADLQQIDVTFKIGTSGKFQQKIKLYENIKVISSPFFDSVKVIAKEAEKNLEPALLPLKEELQKKQPPHLALLFVFLNIFRQLQNDLNGYGRRHLDFFYKDVLQIKPAVAVPDKAHVIFEIQKQLDKYLLKKGLKVKDGKDVNKQEIFFSLDEDIVVNKTEVAQVKTLFLNNGSAYEQTYAEGVYIANDATKADGIDKDFTDDVPKNFPALGAKLSKFSDPETKVFRPYPNARLGFILASPVLYLKEGTRTVTVSIACKLEESICTDIGKEIITTAKDCCDDAGISGSSKPSEENQYPPFLTAEKIFQKVQSNISKQYVYLSEDIFKEAIKKNIDKELIQKIRDRFLKGETTTKNCYCETPVYKTDATVLWEDWDSFILLSIPAAQKEIRKLIDDIFKKENILNVLFSGEKEWIAPEDCNITIGNLSGNEFLLTIQTTINPDQPSVTFYSKQTFNEDFDSTQPVVKIELNDRLKFEYTIDSSSPPETKDECCVQDDSCCLLKNDYNPPQIISYYQFFRNITVVKNIGTDATRIDVQVWGLKNFIVQNDESLQDVNKPVYPFGTRPDIVDFDVNHTIANTVSVPEFPNPLPVPLPNLVGSNFYIGSKEIFLKNWGTVCVNLNWKDKPVNFNDFYTAHIKREIPDPINPPNIITILGLNEKDFQVNLSLLNNGKWLSEKNTSGKGFTNTITGDYNRNLFLKEICNTNCTQTNNYSYSFFIERKDFSDEGKFLDLKKDIKEYNPDSKDGFIKFNLQNQDFLHKDYSYVLARQMMAIGKFPDKGVEGAIYLGSGNTVIVFKDTGSIILSIKSEIDTALIKAGATKTEADEILTQLGIVRDPMSPGGVNITNAEFVSRLQNPTNQTSSLAGVTKSIIDSIVIKINQLQTLMSIFKPDGTLKDDLSVPIPNEPWTPIISNISLDYTATAAIEDIDLIHLYPYSGTYKHEEIQLQPTLFPTFCDEGTLFLGLQNLVPGNNLNILFQLAEATSDSESEKEEVQWHYLETNVWKPLRNRFEVLEDATLNLTTSGVIKFALPPNMTNKNSVMPPALYWIKASLPQNTRAVSETTGIHPQAVMVTFTNDDANDKLRLSKPLPAGSISKLEVADANVKSTRQLYDSFGGEVPEIEQQFYVRVSEHLRHKGRAIQKFDYERLVLEEFPQLFKVKCINHSFALDAHLYKNDFPYAPGYVILAAIPDLNKLEAGNSFEPKVPVSILEKIETFIRARTSPFVRFRAMNPRYEKINFCLRVTLLPGKDENYYKEKLQEDIREFLAPWAVGVYDKLAFGQCVYRSDIIRLLEQTDYVDFITDFRMAKVSEVPGGKIAEVCPDTPRSILIAGNIEVCINKPGCDEWKLCYDENQNKIDCCKTEIVPIANYCNDKIIPIG